MIKEVLNELSKICRAEADRWYREPLTGALLYMNVGERMALIHSEISEAFEGYRKDKQDDHLPNRKACEVELADALIRILDFAGDNDMDIGGAFVEKMQYNRTREDHTDAMRSGPGGKKF
jgi:NTP pyrophosphatase (non-canonical NTP hydrolase)